MIGYLTLCYHYIRPPKRDNSFPLILGTAEDVFLKQIEMLKTNYEIISPKNALDFSYYKKPFNSKKYGVLFTFDDGLSDHLLAAQILARNKIKALFFIPTSILAENMPANPIIIHYCLAEYKISGFLDAYRNALEEFMLSYKNYNIPYDKRKDDPWNIIKKIKTSFKYKLNYRVSRKILLHIYNNLLLRDYKDALSIMHLTIDQVKEILGMGHSIGVHSHSHISVAASDLTDDDFEKEIISPKRYMQNKFKAPVFAFSYPFGEKQDCFSSKRLLERADIYKLVFTVDEILNKRETDPFELGRYMPKSQDSSESLNQTLLRIINKEV